MQYNRTGKINDSTIIEQSSHVILGLGCNPYRNFFTGQNTIYIHNIKQFACFDRFLQYYAIYLT